MLFRTTQWKHAVQAVFNEHSEGQQLDVTAESNQAELRSTEAALKAVRDAWHALHNRLNSMQRYKSAVENRIAETMYNFCYGLTHEINNPLANISARAQGLRAKAKDSSAIQMLDNIIIQTIERMKC